MEGGARGLIISMKKKYLIIVAIFMVSIPIFITYSNNKKLDNAKELVNEMFELTDKISYYERELEKDDIEDIKTLLIGLDISEKQLEATKNDYDKSYENLSDKQRDEITEYALSISNQRILDIITK